MKNVRVSIADKISSFLNGGNRELLLSRSTLEAIDGRELPLVQYGQAEKPMPEIIETSIKPETPLVQGPSNNVFVQAGSALNGFDVTGPTPVAPKIVVPEPEMIHNTVESIPTIQPIMPQTTFINPTEPVEETTIEEAIDNKVLNAQPLETPEQFNEGLNSQVLETPVQGPIIEPVILKPATDPYIEANVEIEKIRAEFNKKIEEALKTISELKEQTNLNLDNVSRSVERARQISSNDMTAIRQSVNNGITSLNTENYSKSI